MPYSRSIPGKAGSSRKQSVMTMAETASFIRVDSVIEAGRLHIQPADQESGFQILDTKTGDVLGTVHHTPNATHEVELFFGKGGFMATVSSPKGLRYFALPGSSVQVGDVSVVLEGDVLTANPQKKAAMAAAIKPQQHTPQATILGAGLATRFERISGNSTEYSKPGVPLVGSQTVIECIANHLARHHFSRIIVNTYFKPESVKTSLTRSAAEEVLYIDEAEPSGTAGGLRKMLLDPQYQSLLDTNRALLVVQGDSVTDADFSALMGAHVAQKALLTIGCQLVDEKDVDKFGIIVTDCSGTDGQSGGITGFQEKPSRELAQSRLGNTGFYIFSPQAYPLVKEIYQNRLKQAQEAAQSAGQPVPTEVPLDFATDIFPDILKQVKENPDLGKFWAQTVGGYWSDIGNPRQYVESVHDIYAGKVNVQLPQNVGQYYQNGIIYWEGTQAIAQQEEAILQGNVVVASPYKSA